MRPHEREERLDWALATVLEPVPTNRTDEELVAAARALFDELKQSVAEGRFPRAEMIITERLSLAAERLPVSEWSDIIRECASRLYREESHDLAALLNAEASLGHCRAQSYGDALEFAERAIRLAGRSQDDAVLALALQSQGACLTSIGDYVEARRVLDAVEVPSERPDILFLQALLECRLEAVTLSDGFHEAAKIAFRTAHQYGLKPSRCSIAAVLLAGALLRSGNQVRAVVHVIPGLEYLIRNRFERLLTTCSSVVFEVISKQILHPVLGTLKEPLEQFLAVSISGFPPEQERAALLLALRTPTTGNLGEEE